MAKIDESDKELAELQIAEDVLPTPSDDVQEKEEKENKKPEKPPPGVKVSSGTLKKSTTLQNLY